MTVQKLLGLLFEHIEDGDITSFKTYDSMVVIDFPTHQNVIRFNEDLLTQYNKIFNYE